jgi:hypothetical protein
MAKEGPGSEDEVALSPADMKTGSQIAPLLKRWYRMDRDKAYDWRIDAAEDFDFVAGRQFSDDEIAALEKKRRPIVVFNRIGTVIDAVTGYEIGNRREVRYIPRELGDAEANELLTSAGEWFNDESGGEFVRSAVFNDAAICGMGWSDSNINFSESPEGKPRKDHLDPFEMVWDRDARARNLSDATRIWRVRRIPLSEAEQMFPGYTKDQLHASWSNINSEADLKRDDASGPSTAGTNNYVTIVQCQYITRQPHYLAEDPTTKEQSSFTEDEFNTANKRLKQLAGMEMQGVKFRKKVIMQAFLGSVVLSYGPAPCPDEFSFQCVTGKFDRNKGTWYGLVRAMKDPQRWANKWLAQMMFIMNSNAKGGLFAEKNAFDNIREAESTYAQPDAITVVNDGVLARGGIKEKQQAAFPAGFQQLTEFAITSIRDVTGVNVEVLGSAANDQPASLEVMRKEAGLNILQWLFDGMKLYSQKEGRVVLYYLQNDLSDGRLIRIVGKDNEKYVPLIKQSDAEYDIVVDDAPTSPNQKERVWAIISGFIPLVGKVIPPQFMLAALKYSPLPASIVAQLQQMADAPNPEAQQAAAARAQAIAAITAKDQSQAQLNQAKAQQAMQIPAQKGPDPDVVRWIAVLEALTKIEVAKITAKAGNDSDVLDAQLEGLLNFTNLQGDQRSQLMQMAHERAMQQADQAHQAGMQQSQQAAASQTQQSQQAAAAQSQQVDIANQPQPENA